MLRPEHSCEQAAAEGEEATNTAGGDPTAFLLGKSSRACKVDLAKQSNENAAHTAVIGGSQLVIQQVTLVSELRTMTTAASGNYVH